MEELAFPIVMAVAVWGGFAQMLRANELLNLERDRIIMGCIDNREIDVDHQRMIFHNDWTPLHIGLIMYLIAFGAIFCILPFFEPKTEHPVLFRMLCLVMSICPFFAAYAFLTGFLRDRQTLKYNPIIKR